MSGGMARQPRRLHGENYEFCVGFLVEAEAFLHQVFELS